MIRVCFHISPTETKFSRGQIVRPTIRRSSIFFIFGSHWISHTIAGREQPWPSILIQEWSHLEGWWINPRFFCVEPIYNWHERMKIGTVQSHSLSLSLLGRFLTRTWDLELGLGLVNFQTLIFSLWSSGCQLWMRQAACAACVVSRVIMCGDNGYHLVTSTHQPRWKVTTGHPLKVITKTRNTSDININLQHIFVQTFFLFSFDYAVSWSWLMTWIVDGMSKHNSYSLFCHSKYAFPSSLSITTSHLFITKASNYPTTKAMRCLLLFWELFIPRWLSQKAGDKDKSSASIVSKYSQLGAAD